MKRRGKIVLYQPLAKDPATGQFPSFYQLSLEMLHVGALPDREGYEVVVIDANLHAQEEAHRRAVDEARDALIFGTTAILGYMVWDGHLAARKVRAACPGIKIVAGGWFPSCWPEGYLETGVYDAVCLGQGELTFLDLVHAVDCGEPLDGVAGLALWRDGQVARTAHRAVAGWDQLARAAWHLIEIEPYRERQLWPGARRAQNRFPAPPAKRAAGEHHYFGISYFSSYGCPEPCAFCYSPEITGRRWKAMPAGEILDELQDLQQRWGFEAVRFQDANWGVDKKRSRAFAEGLLERGLDVSWSATLETFSILRYGEELMDLLRDSGLYLASVGAEAATRETMARVGKPIQPGDNLEATRMLHERGIIAGLTYIIGYPHEAPESMLATLEQARQVLAACPSASVHVYPFRPIPGNPMYREALELGYRAPASLEAWGRTLDYLVMDVWRDHIPAEVHRVWRLFHQYASFHHGIVRPRDGLMERLARWRIQNGDYRLPVDLKLFYVLDKLCGWSAHKEHEKQSWIMAAENEAAAVTA